MTTAHRLVLPAVAAAALLALAGCAPVLPLSGPRISEDRPIEAVDSVVVETSGDLTVTVGDTPSLRITAPSGVMSRLTSEISGDELVLGARGPFAGFGARDIRYELVVPRLSQVHVKGSSDVEADFTGADDVTVVIEGSGEVSGTGVAATAVELVIDGSGDIELTGTTDTQRIEVSGSGDIDTAGLVSRATRIEISGSGDAELHVTDTLDAAISGSAEIRYTGDPRVRSEVSGSGEVRAA
ncbi:MAG TPA: head GIN domain-containing protein [Pseudolysinimonas sp.]|nr:head GIN domain-containing protein [Pseudolysinimonas sp.]